MSMTFNLCCCTVNRLLRLGLLLVLSCVGGLVTAQETRVPLSAESVVKAGSPRPPQKRLFAGRVVLLREAFEKRKIKAFEEYKDLVALETSTGELIPIIPDWRGRAFFQDKRLRNRRVELIGFRRPGIPFLQVITVFTFDEKSVRNYTDYWCDVCSIPMYEIKPCDCCQDDIRLRFQAQDLPADVLLIPKPAQRPHRSQEDAKKAFERNVEDTESASIRARHTSPARRRVVANRSP